jgi:mannose/cellobiose epimerase-like protein (N-acyl-D-glucosamine 2-epimerase family)/anti-anti-sigma regulatory factor
MHFTFSDTIAGYVTSAKDLIAGTFGLQTSDGREFQVKLTDVTYAEVIRNPGEPFQDPGMPIESLLVPGRYMFAYGIFYPEGGDYKFEAKHLVAVGQTEHDWRFESADWWINQIRDLAEFYFTAQFPDGVIDYRNYRTQLTLEGQQVPSTRQETDTISRMVYGFASAYMLTGENRYLEAAEKGTEYLREHMRAIDEEEEVVYWYHAADIQGAHKRNIFASEFGDDLDAIPAYEQIYALAGPVQTYRATGDPRILRDAEMTVNLFDRYFLDKERDGHFSHIDPVTMDPRSESLTHNRARKNWNSVGDHAPAYLINLWLATGDRRYLDMLTYCADLIVKHFPDYEKSPFVNEKFFEDWTHDHETPLQKNRAIVGHNLKIAWNLMRVYHLSPDERYAELARKIAALMPEVGRDKQRGGWYDMVERELAPGEEFHRLIWHDRKAWWQQEQGILAFLILAGSLREPEYLRMARESSAFYNAFFPDNDSAGVYFNVLASGVPYLVGTERLKGSHSMSGYHSFELCYLAAIYTNLLLTSQPMTFYFKPKPGALKDNILRVAPDLLPAGSIKIDAVWINGNRYADFDAEALTVRLPEPPPRRVVPHPTTVRLGVKDGSNAPGGTPEALEVRVRIVPAALPYNIEYDLSGSVAQLTLDGTLDDSAVLALRAELNRIALARPKELALQLTGLHSVSGVCARALAFAQQNLDVATTISIVGAIPEVRQMLGDVGLLDAATELDMDADGSPPGRRTGHSTPRPRLAERASRADAVNRQG